jgi:serine/threonine-protein kinase
MGVPSSPALRAAVLSVSLGLAVAPAQADDPGAVDAGSKAMAEMLFREARSLMNDGEHRAACDKFAESQRLDPALGTLLNLAECHARIGRTASAWAGFRESAEKARQLRQKDRALYAERRTAEMESKLSYARWVMPAGASIERLEVDGRALGRAAFDTPLPLDPGVHDLVVTSSSGTTRRSFTIPARPGEHAVAVAAPGVVRVPPAPAPQPSRPDDSSPDGRAIAGYVGLALGAVGLGMGIYLGVTALSLKEESDAHCDASG